MLIGLFILIAAIAVFLVLNWSAKNDSVSQNGETTGLFAMKDAPVEKDDDDQPQQKRDS